MKKFPMFLVLALGLSGCAGQYVLTSHDIRGAVVDAVSGRQVRIRSAQLVVICQVPFEVVLDFGGTDMACPPGHKVKLDYPNAGLLANYQHLEIPVAAIPVNQTPIGRISGVTRPWYVYGNPYVTSNKIWLLELQGNRLVFTVSN